MNQEKLINLIIKKKQRNKGNSMFRFCINRKIFNFFNRKENNFVYRLTSYRLIRILGKRFVKRFARDLSCESLLVRQELLSIRQ